MKDHKLLVLFRCSLIQFQADAERSTTLFCCLSECLSRILLRDVSFYPVIKNHAFWLIHHWNFTHLDSDFLYNSLVLTWIFGPIYSSKQTGYKIGLALYTDQYLMQNLIETRTYGIIKTYLSLTEEKRKKVGERMKELISYYLLLRT